VDAVIAKMDAACENARARKDWRDADTFRLAANCLRAAQTRINDPRFTCYNEFREV
jgi:hypothetical protein